MRRELLARDGEEEEVVPNLYLIACGAEQVLHSGTDTWGQLIDDSAHTTNLGGFSSVLLTVATGTSTEIPTKIRDQHLLCTLNVSCSSDQGCISS